MQLHIVAVGARMPGWVGEAFGEYAKRMPPEMKLNLIEIKPEQRSGSRGASEVMALEATRIRAALPKRITTVALDERGQDLTTVALAEWLERWRSEGADVAFLIGGADGLDATLKSESGSRIRLSSLTLPHAMVRVLLAEQLYRAWTISQNHPYHRA